MEYDNTFNENLITEVKTHINNLFEFKNLIKNYIQSNGMQHTDTEKKFLNVIDEELANANRKLEGIKIILNNE